MRTIVTPHMEGLFHGEIMAGEDPAFARAHPVTRRRAVAGLAVALGGLLAGTKAFGGPPPEGGQEAPGARAHKNLTSLRQARPFQTDPSRIYKALLDAGQFATFTGQPAKMDPNEGGYFSLFGGLIVGRNVELVPDQRIVQAWRPAHWNPGIYSIVKFELKPAESKTVLVLDHKGFPEGEFDSLNQGWKLHYYDPLEKFLA